MTAEVFSQLASGIQSFVIAASVIAGGVWGLFKLGLMQQIRKARADLEKAEADLALVNRSLRERAVIEPEIQAKQIGPVGGPVHCAMVEVSMQNRGNRAEILDWQKITLTAAKIERTGDGSFECGEAFTVPSEIGVGESLHTSILEPNDTGIFTFLVPFKDLGIYKLQFSAEASPAMTEHARREYGLEGTETEVSSSWAASTYFCVEGNASENNQEIGEPSQST